VLAETILEGLNPEQRRAVEITEGPLLVLAGAGSGKTRVLVHRIAYLIGACGIPPEQILAVTFTNKAAGEMRERVDKLLGPDAQGLWVSTFHSACVRILRRDAGHLGFSRGFAIYDEDDSLSLVKETLRRHGKDPKVHDPRRLRWRIDQWKNKGWLPARAAEAAHDLESEEAADLYATYQRLLVESNALDFGDLILQTVQLFTRFPEVLGHYRRRWSYLLVDEYQDTNRVQYELVKQLVAEHRNLCVVGDPNQCLPPHAEVLTPSGPRAIASLREGDAVVAGAGWGSTARAAVTKVMTRRHRGRMLRIRLRSGRTLEATPNHVCFARVDPVRGMHYAYLMWRRDKGFRIGVTSGVRAHEAGVFLNGVQVRTAQEVADALWILHATADPAEARYHEQRISVRYGIPTMVFHVRGRRMALDQTWIDRLYAEIDTDAAATALMRDLDLDPRYPHHRAAALVRGEKVRRHVQFTMFGDPRPHSLRPWHEHRVQLVTSDRQLEERARDRFPVRSGSRGTWRIETSRKSYDEGLELAHAICDLDALDLVERARLTRGKAFHLMPASHLRAGMAVPVVAADGVVEDVVESVSSDEYDGLVYDLSIDELHNFSAGGVLVHNSIYAWRGANVRNIVDFEREYPDAQVVKLERNYRSTRAILEGASHVVSHNETSGDLRLQPQREGGERIRFFEASDDREEAAFVVRQILGALRQDGRSPREIAVFYRTNAQSRSFEEELLRYDVPYTIVGGMRFYERAEVKDALAYLRVALNPADAAALRRIVNVPARGIGKTTVERADEIAQREGVSLLEGLARFAASGEAGRAAGPIRAFAALRDELAHDVRGRAPAEAIAHVLRRSGYLRALEADGTPEAETRLENLRELVAAAEDFTVESAAPGEEERSALELFLDQVALVSDVDGWDRRAERVSLMTAHAAKGLEFPIVFLAGLEEGVFPHAASSRDAAGVEEERRLFYVGMTRAMERLTLTCARERRRYGSRTFGVPSRFLREIPEEWVEGALPSARRAPAAEPALDYDYAQAEYDEGGGEVPKGVRVRHPVFGLGTVIETTGRGQAQKLRIRFDRVGMKTLLTRFANLEPA
jgi:DNA helicase-2/ATP-dependent DNA helicase PcrA